MGCGTVDRRKGSDLFVLVAHGVQQAWGGPAHFLWLGGALGGMAAYDQKKWILHDIKMFGLEGRVHFLDARPDPEPCFMGADIFLLTSRDDPFPCVIHEAMAAALPIVCFDKAGGTPEALVDGCGRVVPYLDVEAMAKEVIDLLENAASRAEIGCRAEARVRSIYRSEDFSARIVELADQMISSDDATVPRS
jgi:glycosyltransferase involved in cell wall biosynthesis